MSSTFSRTIFTATISFCAAVTVAEAKPAPLSQQEALQLGAQTYVYGYPLLVMEMKRRIMTNVIKPTEDKAPMGQFAHQRNYLDASIKNTKLPNADTLYSYAWINLKKEPYVLHVPYERGRYYLMPMFSAWSTDLAAPGTRTTGTKEQDFVITGPHWSGNLPKRVKVLQAPTDLVWIAGRTYCSGTPQDYKDVHAIQDQYKLMPLSAYKKTYIPLDGPVDPNVNMQVPARTQVNKLNAQQFFTLLAELLRSNPPPHADASMTTTLKRLGIAPAAHFDFTKLDPAAIKGLEQAVTAAQQQIQTQAQGTNSSKNGWQFRSGTSDYGTNYLLRAALAAVDLGATLPEDLINPVTQIDGNGKPLSGKNRYVLHFSAGQTPPVEGFWSLTLYNKQHQFNANTLNRFSVSPRDRIKYNIDGSLDIYVQNESPGKDKEANWLPAPEEDFSLMLRLYDPKPELLEGKWLPPVVHKVKA